MNVDLVRWCKAAQRRFALPAIVIGAAGGYYLASIVGLQLRLPPATTSVMWPPNAVLAAILILSPPRFWIVVLLSALPVHLYLQLQTGWTLAFVLTLFVTNCSEALIAAGSLYLLSDAPARFDTLRRLAAFLLGPVLLAPLLSSFADAGAVAWFQGEAYWHVFRTRSLSNVLAELTVVPAVVGGVLAILRPRRPHLPTRSIEAAILAAGLAITALYNFGDPLPNIPALLVLSSQMPLAVQLPFLLWAAIRFGPTGTGLALFASSLLSSWAVVHGVGPLATVPAATSVTAITLALIVVTTTLLFVSALIEERRQTQQALRVRLRFEGLLARLSGSLMQLPSERMDRAFEDWLAQIAAVLGADSAAVFAAANGADELSMLYSWTDRAVDVAAAPSAVLHLTSARRSMRSRDAIVIATDPGSVDLSASSEDGGFTTGCAVPLMGEGHALGALVLTSSQSQQWSSDLVDNAQLVAEVLASALQRKQSDDALRGSEVMKSAILQSLTSGVAVIDRSGALLQFNERWVEFARVCEWMDVRIGESLLHSCAQARDQGNLLANQAALGIKSVLDGSRLRFTAEHMKMSDSDSERWWAITAAPLNRPEGGAVVTHTEITDVRRAEVEAQRSRQELAHVARVSTVGELTASLAHQLNQPLAAILTNAQVARRILNMSEPNLTEVRAILQDIVKDDRRASDVIQRLRALLRKGNLDMVRINLTATIREVVDLVSSEAIIRNIEVSLAFVQEPLFVRGDRVQLQQVVLNLLHNAMEAMSEQKHVPRTVAIDCRPLPNGQVRVRVQDSGPGIQAGSEDMVFEPFYTTKSGGMGMGLSIVRTIVEAHGGTIHATNDLDRGAVFEFHLPHGDKAA